MGSLTRISDLELGENLMVITISIGKITTSLNGLKLLGCAGVALSIIGILDRTTDLSLLGPIGGFILGISIVGIEEENVKLRQLKLDKSQLENEMVMRIDKV